MATDIDSIALKAAKEVEDIFCQHFAGGRTQRLAAIQVAITGAVQAVWDRRLALLAELRIHEAEAQKRDRD